LKSSNETDDEHFYRKIIVISGTQLHFVKKAEYRRNTFAIFPKKSTLWIFLKVSRSVTFSPFGASISGVDVRRSATLFPGSEFSAH
jgi:hypothetical protein